MLGPVRPGVIERAKPLTVMDPDLGVIQLTALEGMLANTALFQRLRLLRVFPAAVFTYPGLSHTKLEHAIASLGWAARGLKAIDGPRADDSLRALDEDVAAVRLAALLKPIAAGPFGDVLWPLVEDAHKAEFSSARAWLSSALGCVRYPTAEELCAAGMILSAPFLALLERWFGDRARAERLAYAVAGLQLGSGKGVSADYLADFVVGPISAPRLAGLVQANRAAGFNRGFDVDRLVALLVPIKLSDDLEARSRGLARGETVLAVEAGAAQVVEHMALSRALLHSRVIDHPTVRVVNRMVLRLAAAVEAERSRPYSISDLIGLAAGDENWLSELARQRGDGPSHRTVRLAGKLLRRDLPKTALAFGPIQMADDDFLASADAADHQAMVLRELQRAFADRHRVEEIEDVMAQGAGAEGDALVPDVLIDFPSPNWSGAERVVVRSRDGEVALAHSHFAISNWSNMYAQSKWAGRVYCDPEHREAVDRSARSVLAKQFGLELKRDLHLPLTPAPSRPPRSRGSAINLAPLPIEPDPPDYFPPHPPWRAQRQGIGSPYIGSDELRLPPIWQTSSDAARERLARRLRAARPQGYSPTAKAALIKVIDAITSFQAMVYEGGTLQALKIGEERLLQRLFRDHLRSREFRIREGLKLGGGELDLLFEDEVIIEIKIHRRPTDTPVRVGARFTLQARRYALAIDKDIVATFVGYEPRSELGHHPAPDLIDVMRMPDGRGVEVRAWVPIAFTVPSRAGATRRR
jgi:HD superfamily phosphohydrolase